jgi:hypothetical protein
MKIHSTLLFFLAACCSVSVRADVVTFGADRDVSIFQNNVNNSLGGGPGFFAGTNAMNSPRRALISFDVAGSIPAGTTITNVQLTLTLGQVGGATTATLN